MTDNVVPEGRLLRDIVANPFGDRMVAEDDFLDDVEFDDYDDEDGDYDEEDEFEDDEYDFEEDEEDDGA